MQQLARLSFRLSDSADRNLRFPQIGRVDDPGLLRRIDTARRL